MMLLTILRCIPMGRYVSMFGIDGDDYGVLYMRMLVFIVSVGGCVAVGFDIGADGYVDFDIGTDPCVDAATYADGVCYYDADM